MFLGEERQPQGGVAPGGVTGMGDVYDAAKQAAWYVNNTNARQVALEEAYDRRIDDVHKATGMRLGNPMRATYGEYWVKFYLERRGGDPLDTTFGFGDYRQMLAEKFHDQLLGLAGQHPDKVDLIRPTVTPLQDAQEKARAAEEGAGSALARYGGGWGGGALASFAGGIAGGANDPVNWLALAVGPSGGAARGAKGVAWMAVKQGAANASVETLMQPSVAAWRKEAGLGYDAGDFAANVGMAFAFGAGIDASVRGAARGYRAARGHVPIVDKATGAVTGWETPEAALHRAATVSKIEDVAKAQAGDIDAMERLAVETGQQNDPIVRSAIEAARDVDAASTHVAGRDPHLTEEADVQGMRHLLDPDEPPPVMPEAGRPTASVDPVAPEHAAYIDEIAGALNDGRLDTLESAAMLREAPQAAARVEASTPVLRDAVAVARLSDQAFAMVENGGASVEHAAAVGRLVEDQAEHASVLAAVERIAPATPAETRRAIGILTRKFDPVPETRGIDDPHGPEAAARTAQLERSLGVARDLHEPSGAMVAREARPLGRKLDQVKAHIEAEWGRGNPATVDTVGVLSAYDAHGVGGVREFLGGMAPARRRDLAARLAGDMVAEATALGRKAFTELMTARALRHAGSFLGGDHGARLVAAAKDMEKAALAKPKAGEELQPRDRFAETRGSQAQGVERITADHSLAEKAQQLRAAAAAIEDWRNHVPDRKQAEFQRIEREIVAQEGGAGAMQALDAAFDRVAPMRQKIVDAAMARAEKRGLEPERWRDVLKNSERAQIAAFERMLDDMLQGRMPNALNRDVLRRLYEDRQRIEDLARKDRAKKLDEALRLKDQAAAIERKMEGQFIGRVTIPHPDHGNVKLPVNADGTVTFYRGEKRGQQMRGATHRMFTTDLDRAREFAGRDGVIHQVEVPQDKLKEAQPRPSSRDDAGKVRDGQTVFTLSDDLAKRARETAPEGSLEAKALEAAEGEHGGEISLERGLAEADGLERMRDIIEWCKF